VLSVAKVHRGREDYYLATVASARADASALIEPEGRWLGQAAASLGLTGTVEAPALRALLGGADPATGELLSARHDRVRVAAYDCTCSTPKSVSLLHALGREEVRAQVRAGHEEAAAAALGYLERRGARVRRSPGRGEARAAVPARGFAAAAFLHRTSRAPDPHLHSHVLIANLAPGPEGRWSALDARGLFLELRTARDLYETQLRSELSSRLGVSWRQLQGAWADLAGIDPEVRRAFSRRTVEIETALQQSGRSGPRAARIAAVRTRPDKDLATPYEELVSGWRERSYRLGISDNRLGSLVGRSPVAPSVPADRWAERALGEHGVAARDGTCRRGDLVRSRCASLPAGALVAEVERDIERLLTAGAVIEVPAPSPPKDRRLQGPSGRSIPAGVPEPLYTTAAIVAVHDGLTRIVRELPGAVRILAYPPGGRLGALDALGSLASCRDRAVAAVAPGRAAAASFEAVTGIETAAFSGGLPPVIAGAGAVVVVAEAHRVGPWELSSVLESTLGAGGRAVLFAPRAALEGQYLTTAVLAPHLDAFAVELSPADRSRVAGAGGGPEISERYGFAGRQVLVAPDGATARAMVFATWEQGRASGQAPLLVASDVAVVRALRDSVHGAGGSPGDVVEARGLGRSDLERDLVVLGRRPSAIGEAPPARCVQVVIVPPQCSALDRLSRAAEAAHPPYLEAELGPVRSAGPDRAAWRAGAAAIETFRGRWSIDDHGQAFGDRSALRAIGSAAVGDLAETRLHVREAVRAIERAAPARERRALEAPARAGSATLGR
jgi:conjugative relaxase-like TrwC/TraI family protein